MNLILLFNVLWKWILYLIFALLVAAFVRVFIGEVYIVPSDSMEDTVQVGDIIWVNKLKYGTPIYHALICVQNVIFPAFKFNKLTGVNAVERGDVLVFRTPIKGDSIELVKRCIGLPGETIEIRSNTVFINSNPQRDLGLYKYYFESESNPDSIVTFLRKNLNSNRAYLSNFMNNQVQLHITFNEAYQLNKNGFSTYKMLNKKNMRNLFPKAKVNKWTYVNYGPLLIPRKGLVIPITDYTLSIYGDIIKDHERIIIPKNLRNYMFKNNYYFMMGDNRDSSTDSRGFGFVKEQLIEGNVNVVLLNVNDWMRNLKRVR